MEALSTVLPDVDKEALSGSSDVAKFAVEMFHEALRVGSDGWADDDLSFVKPWGFELSEIKIPVLLYQGSVDKMVPFAHGEWLGAHLPQEKLAKHLIQGEGHISIFENFGKQMFDELLEFIKV